MANESVLLVLARTCERFGTTPSALLGVVDRTVAVDLDVTAASRLVEADLELERVKAKAMKQAMQDAKDGVVREDEATVEWGDETLLAPSQRSH